MGFLARLFKGPLRSVLDVALLIATARAKEKINEKGWTAEEKDLANQVVDGLALEVKSELDNQL